MLCSIPLGQPKRRQVTIVDLLATELKRFLVVTTYDFSLFLTLCNRSLVSEENQGEIETELQIKRELDSLAWDKKASLGLVKARPNK